MLFRGRLRPNIQRDATQPLEIRFIRPHWAPELITLEIWELDTYRDPQTYRRSPRSREISEGTDNDLLATFTGRINRSALRRFQVESHTNVSDDAELPTIKIKFQGSDTVYDIPVVSEDDESEGTNWEIAFVVKYTGQDDYRSPISFITRTQGRVLIMHNTMGDLSRSWEIYTNRIHNIFTSSGLEAKIIRGSRSDSTIAHYSASDTTSYAGGYDYNVFLDEARNHDIIFFCCHGNIVLDGALYGQLTSACAICHHRFSHNQFSTCSRFSQCMGTHRGYHRYQLRTSNNAEIRLAGTAGQTPLQTAVSDRNRKRLVDSFVEWDEYESAFASANPTPAGGAATVIANTPPPQTIDGVQVPSQTTHNVVIPNNFQFPTLLAFPTSATRPDFRQYHLPQDPPSTDLHHASAQDAPGNPAICFLGPGGPLSGEVEAEPDATGGDPFPVMVMGDATPFTSAPSHVEKVEGNRQIAISWQEVQGAGSYTLYWSTSLGVSETGANTHAIIGIPDTSYVHSDTRICSHGQTPAGAPVRLTNGQKYYYRVQARRPTTYLVTETWGGVGDLSRVKILYAMCCLTGRKKTFADAVLDRGVKYFIAHQVVIASRAGTLIRTFWSQWLGRGAILRNLINIYNDVVQSNGSYRAVKPMIYYRDAANQTRFWRPGVTPPPPSDIKLD